MRTAKARRIREAILAARWAAKRGERVKVFHNMNNAYQRAWEQEARNLRLEYVYSLRGGERYLRDVGKL